MLNFNSKHSVLVNGILSKALSGKYFGGYFEFSADKEFVDLVKKFTGFNVSIFTARLNNNFPQLQNTTISTKIVDYVVTAGSTDIATEEGKKIINLKARGEFLERLSSSFPLDEVKKNKGSSEALTLFSQKEFLAKKLFSFGYKKIKAQYIYYALPRVKEKNGTYLRQPTTNGGAGHFDYTKAVINGLLETIERDAFLVYWLNTISPKKIDVDSYLTQELGTGVETFKSLGRMVKDFKKYNIEYYFLDITSDIDVPVVCCVVIVDSPTGKRISLGSSAGFDVLGTILASATEAVSILGANYFKDPYVLNEPYVPFQDNVIGRSERLRLYTTDKMFTKASFLIKNTDTISVEDWSTAEGRILTRGYAASSLEGNTKNMFTYLKHIFKERAHTNKDYEVVVYQIKNKLLKHFDYKVVRVFCGALYSIYLNENYADPHHPRLKEFIKNKGLEKIAKLNTLPHLFP